MIPYTTPQIVSEFVLNRVRDEKQVIELDKKSMTSNTCIEIEFYEPLKLGGKSVHVLVDGTPIQKYFN